MLFRLTSVIATASLTILLLVSSRSTSLSKEPPAGIKPTPLDLYVHQQDPNYEWKVVSTDDSNPIRTTVIHLKSQKWLTEKEVDRPLWEHWLIVSAPQKRTTNHAFLMIAGGGNDGKVPTKTDPTTAALAQATGSLVAELKMVPNQPLIFHQDGEPRKEDDLIGYGWAQFLKTGDPIWLPRLPMVKSAVRAMDCLQEYSASKEGGELKVEKFTVAGGSKRGWTTWMTGAADARVEAIVPIVIDVANNEPSLKHHAEVYGFWANAIGNYYQHQILQQFDHPRMKDIYAIVDPYFYRDRLTMPKFIVNAAGDQFFCPDSSQFYFDELKGEKLLRYVPNADHSLKNSDAVESIIAFHELILKGKPRPSLTWNVEEDGTLRAKAKVPEGCRIKEVKYWQANNPMERDFRLVTLGPAYVSKSIAASADGSYSAKLSSPEKGWTASFLEFTFETGGTTPLKLTTEVKVLPDTLPFAGIDLTKVKYEAELKGGIPAK